MAGPPDRDTWRRLMAPALRVIDSLRDNGYGELDFRLGGGTVLMFRFDHRVSKDIDIFTYDAQALSYITPRLNDVAAALASDYQEHANTIKLLLPDGDIDFIVAAPVTQDAACEVIDIGGRKVNLESTAEILAKKLLYRADSFKARDVFDMAVALALDRPSAMRALHAARHKRAALAHRLAGMRALPLNALTLDLAMTETGGPYAAGMIDALSHALSEVDLDQGDA